MSRRAPPPPVFPVYVGHIPSTASVTHLRKLFSRFGRLQEVTIISEHGFVNYERYKEAEEAIKRANGASLMGETLHVDYSPELAAYLLHSHGREVVYTEDPTKKKRKSKSPKRKSRESPPPRRRKTSKSREASPPRRKRSRSRERKRSSVRSRSRSRDRRRQDRHSKEGSSEARRQKDSLERRNRSRSRDRSRRQSRHSKDEIKKESTTPPKPSTSSSGDLRATSGDLREMLKKRKMSSTPAKAEPPAKLKISINNVINIDTDSEQRAVTVASSSSETETIDLNLHQLYIGNLFNDIEEEDIWRLLEGTGKIKLVKMFESFVIVTLECPFETAEAAIKSLDQSLWMDNNIRVKFNENENALKLKRKLLPEEKAREPRKALTTEEQPKKQDKRLIKTRTFTVYSATRPRSFHEDMTAVFSTYGKVGGVRGNADGFTLSVEINSSERRALTGLQEVNQLRYKGNKLRVKFEDGSFEDSLPFRKQHVVEFHDYPDPVLPEAIQKKVQEANSEAGASKSEVPIGVLPSSSGLGAFGATPDADKMRDLIQNVRATLKSQAKLETTYEQPKSEVIGPKPEQLTADPNYLTTEGEIHSVHNKIVLISFYTGFSFQIAKFVPGQMYANGKKSLGFLIKDQQATHKWPADIREFLRQGAKVKMDVRKMAAEEYDALKALTSDTVQYATALVWRCAQKPDDGQLIRSAANAEYTVTKGVVTRLFPKWAVLSTPDGKEMLLELERFFVSGRQLEKHESLLTHLAAGDLLAAQCYPVEYLEMVEHARSLPAFTGPTNLLKLRAQLCWQISAELDPHVRVSNTEDKDCEFLATSSTLNRQLPLEREAQHQSWPATVEEVHLPAGGLLLLDESLGLEESRRRVYFHRSRVCANGVKFQSNTCIDEELLPGDQVLVDVVVNGDHRLGPAVPPLVFSPAFWVATSLQANTRDRGSRLAKALRYQDASEVSKLHADASFKGRVVCLRPPGVHDKGAAVAGVAVIDEGPFAGQRVEFEREQCYVFGSGLEKADLGMVMMFDEPVFIKVKPYNSYCVEYISMGTSSPSEASTSDLNLLRTFLSSHHLDQQTFEQLCRGSLPPRSFLPLGGQVFRGRISEVSRTAGSPVADLIYIEADLGVEVKLMATRESFFVYGNWMGKADLAYLLENDEICFEYQPSLATQSESSGADLPRVSLAWLGDSEDRPRYLGAASTSHMTPKMDSDLWTYVKGKNMDEKMFRALVEGRLPPKEMPKPAEVQSSSSETVATLGDIPIDKETLAQAALLKQMKNSFGPAACMQAMMMLMSNSGGGESSSSSNPDMTQSLLDKLQEMNQKEKKKPEPEPIKYPTTYPAINEERRAGNSNEASTSSRSNSLDQDPDRAPLQFKWKK